MCIKTNKPKKSPKSPECNTEPLGTDPKGSGSISTSQPHPSLQATPSLQGTGKFLEFSLNILSGHSVISDWFLLGKPFSESTPNVSSSGKAVLD